MGIHAIRNSLQNRKCTKMKLTEFKYNIEELEVDFYGDSKIDVFDEEELVLEIDKVDDSIWVIVSHRIEESLITIRKEDEVKLIEFIEKEISKKFDTELPVILHPNFFMPIEKTSKN